jgi:hypothetical protein
MDCGKDFTDADAQIFLIGAMRLEDGEIRKTFFLWLRIARRLGIALVCKSLLQQYIAWLRRNTAGSVRTFLEALDIRFFILEVLRMQRERRAYYLSTFSSALH